jgi:peptidoglycan/LPS O-acetylase OafA/YrhL
MKILQTLKAKIGFYLLLLWASLRTWKARLILAITTFAGTIYPVFASDTTSQITEIVMAWMPLIFLFAMLGVVLGLLKKFGKI